MLKDYKKSFDIILNYNGKEIPNIDINEAIIYYFNKATKEQRKEFLKVFPSFAKKYLNEKLLPNIDYFPYTNNSEYIRSFFDYEYLNKDLEEKRNILIVPKLILDIYFCISHLYLDYDKFLPNFVKGRNLNNNRIKECLELGLTEYINYANQRPMLRKRNEFIKLLKNNKVMIETNKAKKELKENYSNTNMNDLQKAYNAFLINSDLTEFLKSNNISFDECEEMAKAYSLLYLNMDLSMWVSKFKNRLIFKHKYDEMYDKLIVLIDNGGNINELKKEQKNIENINLYFWYYINKHKKNLSFKEKEELEKELNLKLKAILKQIETDKKKKREISKERKKTRENNLIIEQVNFNLFLDDSITSVEEFCKIFDISPSQFEQCILYFVENNNKLGLKIREKLEKISYHKQNKEKDMIIFIKDKIINGIKTENGIRKFDVLDYFLITDISFMKFVYAAKKYLTNEEMRNIRTFFNSQTLGCIVDRKTERNAKTILNIEGAPYTVTSNDVDKVFNFLIDNDVTLYTKVYKIALKRYINGTLDLEKERSYKKLNN